MVNRSQRNQAALTLAVDADTAYVVRALHRDGVEPILLKGPVLSRLLYSERELRPYSDIDLLVAPDQMHQAEATLRELGYTRGLSRLPPEMQTATSWTHPGRSAVDLHLVLHFVRSPPQQLWEAVRRDATMFDVAGTTVLIPGSGVLAMHLSLHAAMSGDTVPKTVSDLERGLATLPRDAWHDALELAAELGAVDAFGYGLALCRAGVRLGSELELPSGGTRGMRLRRVRTAYARPWTIEMFVRQPSVRAAVTAIVQRCFPPSAHLHTVGGRRGPGWLALAYAVRLAGIATRLPGSLVAWARVSGATTIARTLRRSSPGRPSNDSSLSARRRM